MTIFPCSPHLLHRFHIALLSLKDRRVEKFRLETLAPTTAYTADSGEELNCAKIHTLFEVAARGCIPAVSAENRHVKLSPSAFLNYVEDYFPELRAVQCANVTPTSAATIVNGRNANAVSVEASDRIARFDDVIQQ